MAYHFIQPDFIEFHSRACNGTPQHTEAGLKAVPDRKIWEEEGKDMVPHGRNRKGAYWKEGMAYRRRHDIWHSMP